ncbi:MAG TPA: molybdenum cofactor biosynthesis protein MoaE [Desulfomonilaceae bacterium]|nr:molybdenum cofactor biosynthesis protein MoaE [Desulfomonilaceae bacterium]
MPKKAISMDTLIQRVKNHPHISKAGMILCHNGIVRESDRSGSRNVRALRVAVDEEKIRDIVLWAKSQQGIIEVVVEALQGEFGVGDDLMYVVVAGDVRENVFRVMREVVERIKQEGVSKTEIYAD